MNAGKRTQPLPPLFSNFLRKKKMLQFLEEFHCQTRRGMISEIKTHTSRVFIPKCHVTSEGWVGASAHLLLGSASVPAEAPGRQTDSHDCHDESSSITVRPSPRLPAPRQPPSAILITHPVFLETTFNAPWSGVGASSSHRHRVCTSDGRDAASRPPPPPPRRSD